MINWAKLKFPAVALLVLGMASYVVFLEVEANDDTDEQIGTSAVWDLAESDLAHIQQTCATPGADYSRCFIEQMTNAGAPADAVSFTQAYAAQNQGTVALLKDFRPVDSVDLGFAFFPAASKPGWLLLNGAPTMVNVDDLSLLPQPVMMKDPVYIELHKRYPQVTLFAAERRPEAPPPAESLPDGGQRFVVDYELRDRCGRCPALGQARFSFDFDPTGRMTGVHFEKVTAGR